MTPAGTGALLADRYLLGDVLGHGGMARVHTARDMLLGRPVAVKVFRADLDTADAARAQDEMRTLSALSHSGLVRIYDAGTDSSVDGTQAPFLVMELVDGPDLAAVCAAGPLSPARVRSVAADLTDALAYVHSQAVVHRDVKPANIMLGSDGRAMLTDFGIARIVDSARHTATGLTMGTAPYLSPEQVTGADVGPPTDVYALGLVLLECLTGRREYDGHPSEAALARLSRPPQIPSDLPGPWPGLLAAMTATDPTVRPSAQQVAELLSSADATLPVAQVVSPARTQVMTAQTAQHDKTDRTSLLGGLTRSLTSGRPAPSLQSVPPEPASTAVRAAGQRRLGRLTAVVVAAVVALLLVVLAISVLGGGESGSTPGPHPTSQLDKDLQDLNKQVAP